MCGMALLTGDMHRLANRVAARHGELGLTYPQIQAAGGPSPATMSLVEGAQRNSLQVRVAGKLEKALQWAAGSVQAILNGGEPTPLPAPAHRPVHAETSTPPPTTPSDSGVVIENSRKRAGLTVEEAAELSGLSPAEWQHLLATDDSDDEELATAFARMARAVGVQSLELRNAGRPDASLQLQVIEAEERYGHLSAEQLRERIARYTAGFRESLAREGSDAPGRQLRELDRWLRGAVSVATEVDERVRRRDTAK